MRGTEVIQLAIIHSNYNFETGQKLFVNNRLRSQHFAVVLEYRSCIDRLRSQPEAAI